MANKAWMLSTNRKGKKPDNLEQKRISDFFQPLIEEFKGKIKPCENKDWNYITDIYSKWYSNCFYICEKWKSEAENRIKDEYDNNVVRLKYIDRNQFDFSYFRHTGQWHLVATDLTLEECKEMILDNPNFQPLL